MSAKRPLLETVKLGKQYRLPYGSGARVRGSWRLLLAACRLAGWPGDLNGKVSGGRTYAMQAVRWAIARAGGPAAFPPWGPSRHLWRNIRGKNHWKQAVDTDQAQSLIDHAELLGVRLHRPYSSEPWHVEALTRFDARSVYRLAVRRYA